MVTPTPASHLKSRYALIRIQFTGCYTVSAILVVLTILKVKAYSVVAENGADLERGIVRLETGETGNDKERTLHADDELKIYLRINRRDAGSVK